MKIREMDKNGPHVSFCTTKHPFRSVMTGLAPNGYVLMLWKSRCENMMAS